MDRAVLLLVLAALVAIATANDDDNDSVLSRIRRSANPARSGAARRETTPRSGASTSRRTPTSRTGSTTGFSRKTPRIMHGPLVATATEDQDGAASEQLYDFGTEHELLQTAAQSPHHNTAPGGGGNNRRHGYSGTVVDGKSSYIMRYNQGVPIYGAGEPYYFSYTHNFPISVSDFENLVNSHNLPKKYKFSGGLDVTGLLDDHEH